MHLILFPNVEFFLNIFYYSVKPPYGFYIFLNNKLSFNSYHTGRIETGVCEAMLRQVPPCFVKESGQFVCPGKLGARSMFFCKPKGPYAENGFKWTIEPWSRAQNIRVRRVSPSLSHISIPAWRFPVCSRNMNFVMSSFKDVLNLIRISGQTLKFQNFYCSFF